MIKAVIYDVDGTLINSEPLHMSAWDDALKQYGSSLRRLPDSFRASMAGRKPLVIASDMSSHLHLPVSGDQLLATKAAMLLQAVKTGVEEMPGTVSSVKRFHGAGLMLGIGAALDRNYVGLVLKMLGILDLFAAIVSGDQIAHGKPDPETYTTVVQLLGLTPAECVVLEDAKSGIASAKGAGCFCIAISNPQAPAEIGRADQIVTSWDEVTLPVLANLRQKEPTR